MLSCTTIIMAGGRGQRLHPLTRNRAKPAIRFGGLYRIIDFTLSNCLNSDIRRVSLLTQFASTSLERHIRNGWVHLFRPSLGEFIETRPPQQIAGREWYEGTADSIFKNIDILRLERAKRTLILSGDHIYKMDYRKLLAFHEEVDARLSVATVEMPLGEAHHFGVLGVDHTGKVTSFVEKSNEPPPIPGRPEFCLCNMGVYCFDTKYLMDILEDHFRCGESGADFGNDIIPKLVDHSEPIYAYPFEDENKKDKPYWRDIGTLDAFYDANMDLVEIEPYFNLYDREWPIWNFNTQYPPAKTVFNLYGERRVGVALDSLICPGVIISGGQVEKSILSPGVRIHSYAQVHRSILFDHVEIGRGAVVRNAIIESGVVIPEGARIYAGEPGIGERTTISDKGICVVTE
ncbi:MAG: glucose-1-phosphate adenylyltransferase [Calditrichota bacterium]